MQLSGKGARCQFLMKGQGATANAHLPMQAAMLHLWLDDDCTCGQTFQSFTLILGGLVATISRRRSVRRGSYTGINSYPHTFLARLTHSVDPDFHTAIFDSPLISIVGGHG